MNPLALIGIGWKNLVHKPVRLTTSLVGVTFAVLLMLLQSGVYFGFLTSASSIIDRTPADLWIVLDRSATNFESAWPFPKEKLAQVRGVSGIAWAESLIHAFGYLKLSSGEGKFAHVIGFNPLKGIGGPWEIVQGGTAELTRAGTYIVDESSLPQLETVGVGDSLENFGHKLEIVGVSRGVKTWTTYPVIFTSLETARSHIPSLGQTSSFIVAKLEPGADLAIVRERLRRLGSFEVMTQAQFSRRARAYWALKTGIGLGIGLAIALGFIVGSVILGQTMYAATLEHLEEYATLKTLGATNGQVCAIVWFQAFAIVLVSLVIGGLLGLAFARAYQGQVTAFYLSAELFLLIAAVALLMCLAAAWHSVSQTLRVSPASIFRV